ncbi:hypothetical protein IJ472_04575 [bacterium]|nr:hypothetical protein [bacterium]
MCDKKNDSNNENFDKCFKYYEKAIEGRNFHYQNYNTWVNYYSIFNGALFVGYYSLKDGDLLKTIIVLLGFVTAICWHLTVKGHYNWMISWINIVHEYENKLSELSDNEENYYVYNVYTRPKKDFYNKNLSTQKMTSIFTFVVCISWGILLTYALTKILEKIQLFLISNQIQIISSLTFVIVLFFIFCRIFTRESTVSNMKKTINGGE